MKYLISRWAPVVLATALLFSVGMMLVGDSRSADVLAKEHRAGRIFAEEEGGFPMNDPAGLISPTDSDVVKLAQQLKAPQAMFEYVRDEIAYESVANYNTIHPRNVIETGRSNCVGQADLLASLLRAAGMPAARIRVVAAIIAKGDSSGSHAWVEYLFKGKWIVLDPTPVTDSYSFGTWEVPDFYQKYQAIPVVSYNDRSVRYFGPGYYALARAMYQKPFRYRAGFPQSCGRGCHNN